MKMPLVIAHRGDSSDTLENSLEAIRRALLLSADMIELDIRMSRDNGLYILHDKTTGRTADKNIDIERTTAEEIRRIRLKNGEPIPTLPDVLKLVSGACSLNLEIKSSGAGSVTAHDLLSSGYDGHILLSSFKEDEVLAARRTMPDLPTSLIFDVFTSRDVPQYKAQGFSIISLREKTANKKLIAACHTQGIDVYVWTVDEEAKMKKFISWGVDGIYTNRPGVLKNLLRSVEFGMQNTTT
jgi:glycerophosphoryl diester phosphodiesterase